jgi:outer membrane murein-binding lipoprotein Lpp
VQQVISQLEAAKRDLHQVKAITSSAASTMAEALGVVTRVLAGVQNKALPSAISSHVQTITARGESVAALTHHIDEVIRQYRAIGGGR